MMHHILTLQICPVTPRGVLTHRLGTTALNDLAVVADYPSCFT